MDLQRGHSGVRDPRDPVSSTRGIPGIQWYSDIVQEKIHTEKNIVEALGHLGFGDIYFFKCRDT